MKEYKDIKAVFDRGMIRMEFLNGIIEMPDKPGGYVISPGCGSGKTTIIKDIIRQKYEKGILYSAATIEECNLMYQYCKSLVQDINDESKLSLRDLIVLHSGAGEGVDNSSWRDNPEVLADKKILICTHHKLMYEFIPHLTRTTFNKRVVYNRRMNVFERAMAELPQGEYSVSDLPREFILIDELPTLSPIRMTLNQKITKLLAHKEVETEEVVGVYGLVETRTKNITFQKTNDLQELKTYYDLLPEGLLRTKVHNSEISRDLIDETILSMIDSNFDEYLNMDPSETRTIRYSITNFIIDRMASKMLVFDGTGDITFSKPAETESAEFKLGTHKFTLVNLSPKFSKYNSAINIFKIPDFTLKRRPDLSSTNLSEELQKSVDTVIDIVNKNNKTLIITWMNLKSTKKKDDMDIVQESVDESIRLSEFYQKQLERRGVPLDRYSFIHYQSGRDKATNDYREYDSIVFLGEFHVPNSVVDEFNNTFKCKCSVLRYRLYQIIQAICRTRIRLHEGLPINVYFTDDWSEDIMAAVKYYLDLNSKVTVQDMDKLSDSKLLTISSKDAILNQKIKPKWRKDISALMDRFSEIETHLMNLDSTRTRTENDNGDLIDNDKNLTITIVLTLDQLNEICPRKEVQIRSYDQLRRYLEKLNILLDISTRLS